LLNKRLRSALRANAQQVAPWLTNLASDRFAVRQKATDELEKFGEQAEAALRTKLTQKPLLEVRHRIEQLLTRIDHSPALLQALRAVEVLEHIGNAEAKKVLETLASGGEGARLTTKAKASLARLNQRMAADK
jgi:hypothetical protein